MAGDLTIRREPGQSVSVVTSLHSIIPTHTHTHAHTHTHTHSLARSLTHPLTHPPNKPPTQPLDPEYVFDTLNQPHQEQGSADVLPQLMHFLDRAPLSLLLVSLRSSTSGACHSGHPRTASQKTLQLKSVKQLRLSPLRLTYTHIDEHVHSIRHEHVHWRDLRGAV